MDDHVEDVRMAECINCGLPVPAWTSDDQILCCDCFHIVAQHYRYPVIGHA